MRYFQKEIVKPISVAALTPRERDIARYLVNGKSNKYIAIELNISSRTAEAHRARIFRKMGVRNAMELACSLCSRNCGSHLS